ncbi:MAG: phosphatase PAP2 family protein [Sandaracinaceae bacterium]|jgi:membrane-associated phospholipid phosphatase|nr:phosphatase PAP2 family protein [Sandaracinaceae bacterium]
MDRELAVAINQLGAGTIDRVTELVCDVPFLVVLWLGVVVLAWIFDRRRARRVTLAVLAALTIHAIVTELLLKHALLAFFDQRVRPWMAHPDAIVPIGHRFEDSSFPSSHAATTAALVAVLVWHYPRSWPLGVAFALFMAFARVHNGMHYPTDVGVGTLLGLAYGALTVWIIGRFDRGAEASRSSPTEHPSGEGDARDERAR